ncbi:MAG: hypothetical protein J6D21_09365 [Clostridia bacterium]|nr:hypothetical protein [Clostridia bacterium]
MEHWIWLDPARYPDRQTTVLSGFLDKKEGHYTVAEFRREYVFDREIRSVSLRVSADTEFRLLRNGTLLATGPANRGGDFMANEALRPNCYATVLEFAPGGCSLDFFARVKMMPVFINEYSSGHGGFMLSARVTFADGTLCEIGTDERWQARRNGAYVCPGYYDNGIDPDGYAPAAVTPAIWQVVDAPIPVRDEWPAETVTVRIAPGEAVDRAFSFDTIYAGYLKLDVHTVGEVTGEVFCFEVEGDSGSREAFRFTRDGEFVGLQLHSVGGVRLSFQNRSETEATLTVTLLATCYPVQSEAKTRTSDGELNAVLEVCARSLKYCRQLMHLDSPRHSEPLACTGDYYIETMMTACSFGDLRLSRFDAVRTAELLRQQGGVMFHTTYSMIWVRMLYDLYLLTGDRGLLLETEDALVLLLDRFRTYLGDNGLIETPPSYMFIDWLVVDGISLHHPPKALGQTCLNLFYYGALTAAARVFDAIDRPGGAARYRAEAAALKEAINANLFDRKRGLYFEGLNTPTPEELIGQYMPQNVETRYYRIHANVLAACFGVAEDGADLLRRTLTNPSLGVYQPYFAHFVLEAVRRCGLREEFTLPIISQWKEPVRACPKGLPEGFYPPEPTYRFDHSHAWGGTPLYALPMALTGLEICEAGFKAIRLSPTLLGLSHATVEIPTPYGTVTVRQEEGRPPEITLPHEITLL